MSDLGCWRQGDHIVVRYYGSEHLMQQRDAFELANHIQGVVDHGMNESLGEDCKALRHAAKVRPSLTRELFEALKEPEVKLRRL